MSPGRALTVGELVWDMLPDGPRLGGGAVNVAAHLSQLGHETALLTAVGDDALGRRALRQLRDLGVRTDMVQVTDQAPTGQVDVQLDASGSARYRVLSPAAWELIGEAAAAVQAAIVFAPDAIVLGTGPQRSPATRDVTKAIRRALAGTPVIYDVNLREGMWDVELVNSLLNDSTVAKLNTEEVQVLAPLLNLRAESFGAFARALAERYALRASCVTLGKDGAIIWMDGRVTRGPGLPIKVVDTIGAGDAFTAALLHGLLSGWRAPEIVGFSNRVGALVASRAGATPRWNIDELAAIAQATNRGATSGSARTGR